MLNILGFKSFFIVSPIFLRAGTGLYLGAFPPLFFSPPKGVTDPPRSLDGFMIEHLNQNNRNPVVNCPALRSSSHPQVSFIFFFCVVLVISSSLTVPDHRRSFFSSSFFPTVIGGFSFSLVFHSVAHPAPPPSLTDVSAGSGVTGQTRAAGLPCALFNPLPHTITPLTLPN